MTTHENNKTPARKQEGTSLSFSTKTLQDYEVISVIGNGTFGTCFKVRDKESGKIFVWKRMDYEELSKLQKQSLISEIRLLRQLQHPNIVQYFHHLVNYEAKSIFIVMEYCEGGDIAQLIAKGKAENRRFEERYIWRVLLQVCRALQVCHNNSIKGTILHRDIKPANIFLDMEGNVKLGDFGLARMLGRNETFAETFVGTPYYMSPEIVRRSKYDRKSDVWALGCLIYEMCTLRPPFKGKEFNQLSANISIGKFSGIPDIYSKDLQEIISFMLEVENKQRPSIEIVSRHPLLLRNIKDLGNDFPVLIDIEVQHKDFYAETEEIRSPSSSTMLSEQNSFHEGYGQRCLSITGIFTPDSKGEPFHSTKRKIFPFHSKLKFSDPELYESIKPNEFDIIDNSFKNTLFKEDDKQRFNFKKILKPDEFSGHVFEGILQERLHAIAAQESLLTQREKDLNAREKQLNEKEKRLIALEHSLILKFPLIKEAYSTKPNSYLIPNTTNKRLILPLPEEVKNVPNFRPPIHDDTYCSIETSDATLLHQPTMAKINIRAFPSLRRVTFQSPKKLITYDIESKWKKHSKGTGSSTIKMHSYESEKASTSSTNCTTKRKSILSMFRLNPNKKESTNSMSTSSTSSSALDSKPISISASQTIKKQKDHRLCPAQERITSECKLTNIWTIEHKKAAFEMLAAMNAGKRSNQHYFSNAARHHNMRQSVRDHNVIHRSHLRRSLMAPIHPQKVNHQREQIVI